MPGVPTELGQILAALARHRVAFILVGGGAAVVQGAPITTQDLDIVHERSPENVERLLAALSELEAKVDDLAGRSLRVDANALLGPGQSLLRTTAGRLDVLGTLHDGRGYAELLEHTDVTRLAGHDIRVVDLPTLIEIKSTTGRAKDRLMVPILLELARKRGDAPAE